MRRTAAAGALLILGLVSLPPLAGAPAVQAGGNPFRGRTLYVNPNTDARRQADQWQRNRADDAQLMRHIAEQPIAIWLGDWTRDPRREIDGILNGTRGAMPVVVIYNIPHRDCGLYSRGGAGDADGYRRWMLDLARGIRNRPVAIIVEPDAIPAADCLPVRLRDERFVLVREAVEALKAAGAAVYVDAGNAGWKTPADMADRLRKAGVEVADGFSLNVSNFQANNVIYAYGDAVSRLVGGKHYVIDTSRNGRGGTVGREWCNPPGQALGQEPSTNTGRATVDAFLWVKVPGQSDGTCNGGPRAGQWWPEYALALSRAAR